MPPRHLSISALLVLATLTVHAESSVNTSIEYRIDPFSDPESEGAASQFSNTPGEALTLTEPNGKGQVSGSSAFGSLAVATRLDPDFQIEDNQVQEALASAGFSDTLTITGSNTGQPATATFRLRVRGVVRQPFFVSEAIGTTGLNAELSASGPNGGDSDSRFYSPEPPEPNPVQLVDDTLDVTVNFLVGETLVLNAGLSAESRADITVEASALDFEADFDGVDQGAVLEAIVLSGVASPAISASSGNAYSFTDAGVAAVPVPLVAPAALVALGAAFGLAGIGAIKRQHRTSGR